MAQNGVSGATVMQARPTAQSRNIKPNNLPIDIKRLPSPLIPSIALVGVVTVFGALTSCSAKPLFGRFNPIEYSLRTSRALYPESGGLLCTECPVAWWVFLVLGIVISFLLYVILSRFANIQAAAQGEFVRLGKIADTLQKKNEILEAESKKISESLDTERQRNERLEATSIKEREQHYQILQEKDAEAEVGREENARQREQLGVQQEKIANQIELIQTLKEEVRQLSSQKPAPVAEQPNNTQELADLRNAYANATAKCESLLNDLAASREHSSMLQAELTLAREERNRLEEEINELEDAREELQAQTQHIKEQYDIAQGRISQLARDLQEAHKQLKANGDDVQNQVAQLKIEALNAKQEHGKAQDQLKAAIEENRRVKRDISQLQETVERYSRLDDDLERYREADINAQAEINRLHKACDSYKSDLSVAAGRISALQRQSEVERVDHVTDRESLNKRLESIMQELSERSTQLNEAQRRVAELNQKLAQQTQLSSAWQEESNRATRVATQRELALSRSNHALVKERERGLLVAQELASSQSLSTLAPLRPVQGVGLNASLRPATTTNLLSRTSHSPVRLSKGIVPQSPNVLTRTTTGGGSVNVHVHAYPDSGRPTTYDPHSVTATIVELSGNKSISASVQNILSGSTGPGRGDSILMSPGAAGYALPASPIYMPDSAPQQNAGIAEGEAWASQSMRSSRTASRVNGPGLKLDELDTPLKGHALQRLTLNRDPFEEDDEGAQQTAKTIGNADIVIANARATLNATAPVSSDILAAAANVQNPSSTSIASRSSAQ